MQMEQDKLLSEEKIHILDKVFRDDSVEFTEHDLQDEYSRFKTIYNIIRKELYSSIPIHDGEINIGCARFGFGVLEVFKLPWSFRFDTDNFIDYYVRNKDRLSEDDKLSFEYIFAGRTTRKLIGARLEEVLKKCDTKKVSLEEIISGLSSISTKPKNSGENTTETHIILCNKEFTTYYVRNKGNDDGFMVSLKVDSPDIYTNESMDLFCFIYVTSGRFGFPTPRMTLLYKDCIIKKDTGSMVKKVKNINRTIILGDLVGVTDIE